MVNALDLLRRLREAHPDARIFANHQPVHHKEADRLLQESSIQVLESGVRLRPGDLVIGSAHGTPIGEIEAVTRQGARFVDGVCPLVEGNFEWIRDSRKNNIIYIGKPGHREYEATVTRAREENCFFVDLYQEDVGEVVQAISEMGSSLPIVLLRQTTIPANDPHFLYLQGLLKQGLPQHEFVRNHGECFATQNRQESLVRGIEQYCPEAVLVLTAENSSNGMALVHTAEGKGVQVLRAEHPHDLVQLAVRGQVFSSMRNILLVAAASVVETVIEDVVQELHAAALRNGRQFEVERPWLVSRDREPVLRQPQLPT